jgi:DNA repair protein RecO (recombination protein O)
MLVKTEAVVLKSMKYNETSKIVTFYSNEYGKVKGIAKGARSAKNKFGAALEPFSYSLLLIYKKEHRDLHLISQCDLIQSWKNLTGDYDRMMAGLSILKLMNKVTHHEERSPALFRLLVEILRALDASTKNYEVFILAFQLRLADLFGYSPNFETCSECKKPVLYREDKEQVIFQIMHGSVLCSSCSLIHKASIRSEGQGISSRQLSMQGLQIIRRLFQARLSSLSNLEYNAHIGNEIGDLIRLYMQYHFDDMKSFKKRE